MTEMMELTNNYIKITMENVIQILRKNMNIIRKNRKYKEKSS